MIGEQRTTSFVNGFVDGGRVLLLYRDQGGTLRQKSVPAEYVTYHPRTIDAEFQRALRKDKRVLGVAEQGRWLRVRWRDRWERKNVCVQMRDNGIPVMEGDVDPVRRFMSDTGCTVAKPRRLDVDIEVDNRKNFVQMRGGQARVLSWAAIDPEGREHVEVLTDDSDAAERQLLEAFWAVAGTCDQLCAWSGQDFDFPIVEQRSKHVGAMPREIRRWLWLDSHDLFEKMNKNASPSGEEKESLKLGDLGLAMLGWGKDDFDVRQTYARWAEGPGSEGRAALARYNLRDVKLMRALDDKVQYAALLQAVCEVTRNFGNTRAMLPTVQMDGYLLRLGVERGEHFPTRFFREEDEYQKFVEQKVQGAYVLHPTTKGIIEDVHVCDFASLYPSAIITWNISPETKLGRDEGQYRGGRWHFEDGTALEACRNPGTGICFRTDVQGLLPFAVSDLVAHRQASKKKQASLTPGTPEWVDAGRTSNGYKVVVNSFFGATGNRYSRFYDPQVTESITLAGAWVLRQTLEQASARGMSPVYGDTDSAFVTGVSKEEFQAFVEHCNAVHFPAAVAATGAKENRISLEYEKEFKRIVFFSAKRYMGSFKHYKGKVSDETSKPEVKGIEWRRGDTARLARSLQYELIMLFHRGVKEPAPYLDVVRAAKRHVLEGALTIEEVRVSATLSQEIDEYKVKAKKDGTDGAQPAHVRVARLVKERGGEVIAGTRIEYFTLDDSRKLVLPAEDFQGECDRFHLWENKVFQPSSRLLLAIFPELKDELREIGRARPAKVRARAAPRTGSRSAKAKEERDELGDGTAGAGADALGAGARGDRGVVPGGGAARVAPQAAQELKVVAFDEVPRKNQHTCHAAGCDQGVRPERLMCGRHWAMVPKVVQDAVWEHYRPGQCDDKRPSQEWHAAADAAIGSVARQEGRGLTGMQTAALVRYGLPVIPRRSRSGGISRG